MTAKTTMSMMRMMTWATIVMMAAAGASTAEAASPQTLREVYQSYRDNVVAITYTLRPKEKPTGGDGRKVEDAVCGVIVDSSGLIITSGDPFPDPGGDPKTTLVPLEFKVHLRGGRPVDAEAVGLNRELNLAYLRLKNPPQGLRPLRFAESAKLDIGDPVVVIGLMSRNYDYEPIFYTGVVNAVLSRPRRMYSLDLFLQDLSIGGVVVGPGGQPIGIIGEDVLKEAPTGDHTPSNVLSIFGSLTQGARVGYPMVFPFVDFAADLTAPPAIDAGEKRSWLGIVMQPLNEDLIDYWKLDADGGIIISSVLEGSPAEKAGLKPGDIIISLQGEPVRVTKDEELAEFRRSIERLGVGKQVDLVYLRQGARLTTSFPLDEAPKTAWTAEELKDEDLGVTVREITIDDIQGQNLEPTTRGVVVSELEQAGWSQLAGLQQDDIIESVDGHVIVDLASYRTQTDRLKEDKPDGTVFFVLRQGETLFVRIKTPFTKGR